MSDTGNGYVVYAGREIAVRYSLNAFHDIYSADRHGTVLGSLLLHVYVRPTNGDFPPHFVAGEDCVFRCDGITGRMKVERRSGVEAQLKGQQN